MLLQPLGVGTWPVLGIPVRGAWGPERRVMHIPVSVGLSAGVLMEVVTWSLELLVFLL